LGRPTITTDGNFSVIRGTQRTLSERPGGFYCIAQYKETEAFGAVMKPRNRGIADFGPISRHILCPDQLL
jgi:hypothetical protein